MDAPTVVVILAASAAALKILADLTTRHLAMERIRLKNEARAAEMEAAINAMAQATAAASASTPDAAGGTGTRAAA
ncbi:hypothetical protein [Alienimonas sp. DA493]|uniref:hypothetical protein n=1 Tax=Alienimonas sp. DA493 TaxID=3373605 RepID=UPI00375451BD